MIKIPMSLGRFIIVLATLCMIPCGEAEQLDPLSPEESLRSLRFPTEIEIQLVAAEPIVADPVALGFGAAGAMYVAENRDYPTGPAKGEQSNGRIARLVDQDGDGYFETRTNFEENLRFPNGVMAWDGGLIVTDAPEVLFLKDTDGDGRADQRKVLLEGFSLGGSSQLRVSHPTLGLDGWIHFTNGLSGGTVRNPERPDLPPVKMGSYDLRYDPLSGRIERTAGNAQFGLAFDDWGNKFVCSNRKHIEHAVLQPKDLLRNPLFAFTSTTQSIPDHGGAATIYPISENITTAIAHSGTFTAACGLAIYRGTSLPPSYRGNAMVCDPTGNLVHRDLIEPSGATFIAKRAREGIEFIASTDNWFRPVFLTGGPDGALYICDMYRKTIEHPAYLPKDLAAQTDFTPGNDLGRIYRVIGTNSSDQNENSRDFNTLSVAQLCEALASSNGWERETAHRLLLKRHGKKAGRLLEEILQNSNSTRFSRLHALHILSSTKALTLEDARTALNADDEHLREHGVMVARSHAKWIEGLLPELSALAKDSRARVRFAAALALGDIEGSGKIEPLTRIAREDAADPWIRTAILSSIGDAPSSFAKAMIEFRRSHPDARADLGDLMADVGKIVASGPTSPPPAEYCNLILGSTSTPVTEWKAKALRGFCDGLRSQGYASDHASIVDRIISSSDEGKRTPLREFFDEKLAEAIRDNKASAEFRALCVSLYAYYNFDHAQLILEPLLSPNVPSELQLAAVRALSAIIDDRVAATLLKQERWRAYSPAVRSAVLDGTIARSSRASALLEAIEREEIQRWSLSPLHRRRLLSHGDPSIKGRAEKLFGDSDRGERQRVFEEYRAVLKMPADGRAGHDVFLRTCASCHVVDGEGSAVGPNLSGLSHQSSEALLLHIIIPNHEVVEGYVNYIVETADGETLSGIIASETETSITLRISNGGERSILRKNIKSLYSSKLSMMPVELEKSMTRQEMRNLIAFLQKDWLRD